jgi:hypothetical protein
MLEDHCSSARPAYGPSRRRNDYGEETEGWDFTTQQEPEGAGEDSVEICLPLCHQEGSWRFQARTAQGNGRPPVCEEVPGYPYEGTLLRRIAPGGTLDLRHIAVALHDAGPRRVPLTGRPAEPDGLALNP